MRLRARRLLSATIVAALAGSAFVALGASAANAVSIYSGSRIYTDQVFSAYVGADETLDVTFTRTQNSTEPVTITVLDPAGATALTCTHPGGTPNGTVCSDTGLSSATAGVWTIDFDSTDQQSRYTYAMTVRDDADAEITGRIWTTRYEQYQTSASTQSYWIATREGYLYGIQLINYNGIGSALRSNGFGLVEAGTCTPIYRSAEGTSIGANGVFLDPSVEYSTECGDDYLLFLEEPAADLPASAPSADGEVWIRPAVVAPSATNLAFTADGPLTRAGDITFDLAGVNGGYEVQIDTNADGDYTDPTDRIIPWGSPPGAVSVPFDGLDGVGNPIGVCQPMNARVIVDRVGETHFVLEDVEQIGNAAATAAGIRLTGLTDIAAPAPLLYWDDTALAPRDPEEPFDGVDGTAGFDTTTLPAGDGAHGWRDGWGDTRSIENWTFYQAEAGAEVAIEPPCNPAMTIDKQAELNDTNGNGRADVDETIDYTFLVANTGNAPLTGVTVTDPLVDGITPATADIAPGMTQLFTAEPYVVTQADVDAGQVRNSAVATGEDPGGEEIETPPDTTIVLGPDREPELTIEKTGTVNDQGGPNWVAEVGETVSYTFLVTNTGNVTLENVTVVDDRVTGISPAPVTLTPGQSQEFTADPYEVTVPDTLFGSITNTAFATGDGPMGEVASVPDIVIVPTLQPETLIDLEKTGELLVDADEDGVISVGDTVEYTFEVTNIGPIDLFDAVITDPRLTGPTEPATADLPAGGTATFTAEYIVDQDDIDAGELRNTAFATATWVSGEETGTIDSAPDTAVLPTAEWAPELEIVKTGTLDDVNENGFADVGETVSYEFEVTNTGNTTLVGVNVVDERLTGLTTIASLAPGASGTITADPYVVTQADVDAGGVLNVAVARGNVPGGPETTSPPDEEFVDGPPPAPGLELEKQAELDDANGNGVADAGESIVYSFLVANTGNVTLFDVTIDDPMLEGLLPEPLDQLVPNVVVQVSAEPYVVTPEDVAAGELVNVATATGVLLDGETVVESNEDTATLPTLVPPGPGGPGGGMANTGAEAWPLLAGGLLALLLGGAAVAAGGVRRRRSVRGV